jgi:hypothetical protein
MLEERRSRAPLYLLALVMVGCHGEEDPAQAMTVPVAQPTCVSPDRPAPAPATVVPGSASGVARPIMGWMEEARGNGLAPLPKEAGDRTEPAPPPPMPGALAARYRAYEAELARRRAAAPNQSHEEFLAEAAALKAQMVPQGPVAGEAR